MAFVARGLTLRAHQRSIGSALRVVQSSSAPSLTSKRVFSAGTFKNARVVVKVPEMAESISEGTVASIHKQVGEKIEADDDLANIETDKIDVSINAPENGTITEILISEGDIVKVGQDVAVLETSEGQASTPGPPPKTVEEEPAEQISSLTANPPATERKTAISTPNKGERVVKLSRMRLAIARNLKEAQNTCASTTTYQEIDMSYLLAWRKQHRDRIDNEHGVRLGYMGAFTKATTLAAKQVPELNASIDIDNKKITYRDYTNIGIAVSTPKGLVTPVVRNTEDRTIVDLERDIAALATKARDGKLVLEDLEGGHYSISNPGIFGSLYGTPLIPLNQVAVFNMNSMRERVVPIDGKIEIRPMMIVSLTYDHRLIDGLEAVKFLNLVREYIQSPETLPLE